MTTTDLQNKLRKLKMENKNEAKGLEDLLKEKELFDKEFTINDIDFNFKDFIHREITIKGETLFKHGVAALKENKLIEALGYFYAALTLNPKHGKAMNNLAISFYKLGQKEKAVEILKELLNMDPENKTASENLKIIEGELYEEKEEE